MFFQKILTLSLVLMGFALSIVIIPEQEELALIYLRDKKFEKAHEIYQRELAKGNKSSFILMPMIKLKLHYGKVDNATTLMEDHVKKNPNSTESLSLLAKYYQFSQRYDDYLLTLESLANLEPSEENLRDLSKIYNYNGRQEKQIHILEKLIKSEKAQLEDYLSLINLLSTSGDFSYAFQLLKNMQKEFPKKFLFEHFKLAIDIFLRLENDHEKTLFELAFNFHDFDPNVDRAIKIAQILSNINQFDLAKKILELHEEGSFEKTKIYGMLNQLKIQMGEGKEVVNKLLKQFQEGEIPSSHAENFIRLLIDEGKSSLLLDYLPRCNILYFSEETIIMLAEAAQNIDKAEIAEHILKIFNEQGSTFSVKAQAMLSIATKDPLISDKLLKSIDSELLTNTERQEILHFAINTGDDFLNYQISAKILQYLDLSKEKSLEIALSFIRFNKAEEGYLLFSKFEDAIAKNKRSLAWVFLSLANKHEIEVKTWLKAHSDLPENILLDLFYLSQDKKLKSLSLILSKQIFSLYPSKEHRSILAQMYIENGQMEKALVHYRKLSTDGAFKRDYLNILIQGVKEGFAPPEELTTLLEDRLKIPLISTEEKREIAYLFGELLNKQQSAKHIFFELANQENPKDTDIDALLYFSQLKSDQEMLSWAINKTKTAIGNEKFRWMKRLLDYGCSIELVAILEEEFSKRKEPFPRFLVKMYLTVSQALAKEPLVEKALNLAFSYETDPSILMDYAQIAFHYNFYTLCEKILSQRSNFSANEARTTLLQSLVAYRQKQYDKALDYFKLWEKLPELPDNKDNHFRLLAHFFYAEHLWKLGRIQQAEGYFQKVISHFRAYPPSSHISIEAKLFTIQALYHTGNKQQALDDLDKLARLTGFERYRDVYYQAMEYKHKELALITAKKNYQHQKTTDAKTHLALAYMENADIENALFWIRDLWETEEETYFSLLYENASKNQLFSPEFIQAIEIKLQKEENTEQTKRQYAHMLLKFSKTPNLAASVFFDLAKNAPFDSDDIQQLLYLWGPRPKKESLDWMKKRFAIAQNTQEKLFWIQKINRLAPPQVFFQLFKEFQISWPDSVQDIYLRALEKSRDYQRLSKILNSLLKKERKISRLQFLAEFSLQTSLKDLNRDFLKKILTIDKEHLFSIREIGILEFEERDYSNAKILLSKFIKKYHAKKPQERDILAFFNYGEILFSKQRFLDAQKIFSQCRNLISKMDDNTVFLQNIQAQILYREGDSKTCVEILEKLIEENPKHSFIKLTLAHILMDLGRYEEAETLLIGITLPKNPRQAIK